MATTTGGTTYVTSTDLVADYPTASLALANRVDVVASGSMSKKTASYTVTVADILAGTTICMNSASATVITLPSTSLVNGMQLNVFSVNTGAVTFTGGTVTGQVSSITAQYSGVSLTYDSVAAVWWCLPFAGGSAKATVSGTTGSPTITTVGSKTIYKWTGSGTVTLTAGILDALVVGGGGGGTTNFDGAGGGAGGLSPNTTPGPIYVEAGTFNVSVGSGGSAAASGNVTFFARIYAGPGGAGAPYNAAAASGACGGGGNRGGNAGSATFGNQGFAGGSGATNAGGGGGGVTAVGSAPVGSTAGAGGAGVNSSITGSSVGYGGGGAGGGNTTTAGTATHGGGNGAVGAANASNGTANTGGGGGGSYNGTAGAGGSGVVILSIG